MAVQIQYRRDTASNWSSNNPTLALGEPGYEIDTGRFKIGNGEDDYNSLSYASGIPGMTWRGEWDVSTEYVVRDVVSFTPEGDDNPSLYIALDDTTGDEPPASPWDLLLPGPDDGGSLVDAHESAGDPHSQYATDAKVDALDYDDVNAVAQVGGTIRGYVEPGDTPGDSGTVDLDLSAHNVFEVTPTGTIGFTFSGLPSAGDSRSATIIVRNDDHVITWPAGTRFAGGEAPELDGETWLVVVAFGSELTVFESATGVSS